MLEPPRSILAVDQMGGILIPGIIYIRPDPLFFTHVLNMGLKKANMCKLQAQTATLHLCGLCGI